jgi:hypothetical protein
MRASTNSANSRSSKHRRRLPVSGGVVLLLAAVLSVVALLWFHAHGYTLYYGDAEAHLNIARRIWDNREPAYREIGTVWLPLPHLLMLPLTVSDDLWQSGLAGAIPSALCYILACYFFFRALRSSLDSVSSAFAGVSVLALNPNLLYLQSAPMTEALFLACLAALLYATVRDNPWGAGFATLAATLTRYEGWFLIPAVFAYFLWRKRYAGAIVYGVLSSVGPLYWLIHNWWLFGSALYFYDGPWSAKAIYQRQLDTGMTRHPADGNWSQSFHYFFAAAGLTLGEVLIFLGMLGAVFAVRKYAWPVSLLALPPAFYMWSLHSSGTPIFIPTLWPFSYYNTRYSIALLPLLAFGVAALVSIAPKSRRTMAAAAAIVLCMVPWLTYRNSRGDWMCWKESEVNSKVRRQWSAEAADFMRAHYRNRDGIWYDFGDLTAILRQSGIPLRETLHDGNELNWVRTVARPDLFLREKWVITFAGSPLARALSDEPYERAATFPYEKDKAVEIYRRVIRNQMPR